MDFVIEQLTWILAHKVDGSGVSAGCQIVRYTVSKLLR
jgi:hypothetical protein